MELTRVTHKHAAEQYVVVKAAPNLCKFVSLTLTCRSIGGRCQDPTQVA